MPYPVLIRSGKKRSRLSGRRNGRIFRKCRRNLTRQPCQKSHHYKHHPKSRHNDDSRHQISFHFEWFHFPFFNLKPVRVSRATTRPMGCAGNHGLYVRMDPLERFRDIPAEKMFWPIMRGRFCLGQRGTSYTCKTWGKRLEQGKSVYRMGRCRPLAQRGGRGPGSRGTP